MSNDRTISLLRKLANLNPECLEVGPGMLAHIIRESTEILKEAEEKKSAK